MTGWRSAAVALPDGAEVAAIVRALTGDPAPGRLWIEDAGSPERRARELGRPVGPGRGSRSVLLRYPDGSRELIVVTRHSAPSRRAEPPDWGLGKPLAMGGFGTAEVRNSPIADLADATEPELVAALGLVLSHYTDRVRIGLHPDRVVSIDARPEQAVAAYLAGVSAAVAAECATEEEPPVVGLASWLTPVEVIEARPFLSPPYPLSLAVQPAGVELCYRPGELADEIVTGFARQLATARRRLAECDPTRPLAELDILENRRAIADLGGLNRPIRPISPARLIHRIVEDRVAEQPDAIAVCAGDERLSYAELNERADRVAAALASSAGARIGICLDRSPALVAVLLGVLKAGASYVPMDPNWPAERRAFVARDAGLTLLITDSADGTTPWLTPDELFAHRPDPARNHAEPSPDQPAYVIYTSGSTGLPKGVAVPHRNVGRLLDATAAEFALGPADVWTQFHSVAFDFSVWEIWGCLMTGGRLVLVPYRTSRAPAEFAALLAAERVSVLNQTPSAFGQLLDIDRETPLPDSLRLVIFGGEPLDTRSLVAWFDRHPERSCRLVNMYGITETTVHVTAQDIGRAEALTGSRSVGRPLPGWQVYLRDQHGRLLPPGAAGEIYVGGAGVAGYLNRPELAAVRFLPDEFGDGPLYRTGDLGRLRPDGRLDHLGRVDSQVQLRGHRVELGEVRARLLDTPGVRTAAVVLRQDPADPIAARLDAYVVGDAEPEQVRRHAAAFLPDYMVPATVTRLPALPLTSNGKVDEARLPEPGSVTGPGTDIEPTGNGSTAGTVQAAWEQVFGFRVDPDDDFFALGGNSLTAVRLLAALHSAGLPKLSVSQLYRNRTVHRLIAVLEAIDPVEVPAGIEVPA
jgi:amino acid adenylation domain-containing protein